MRSSLFLCLVFGALVVATPALAWRAPSVVQRHAIIAAILKNPSASGATHRFVSFRVSTVDPRYASAVDNVFVHGEQIHQDRWVLLDGARGWRVIFVGSDAPPCNVAPAAVRRDLLDSTI